MGNEDRFDERFCETTCQVLGITLKTPKDGFVGHGNNLEPKDNLIRHMANT